MPRKRSHTRKHQRAYPAGVLDVRLGGYGFVKTAEGEYFIPQAKMGSAFNGDLVEIAPLPRTGTNKRSSAESAGKTVSSSTDRPAARVVRVITRAAEVVVGRYEVCEPFGVVVPVDPRIHHDIFTLRADNPTIKDGSLVKVRITTFPGKGTAATGVVEEVLGAYDDTSADIDLIIAQHKLETSFSAAALEQAEAAQVDAQQALLDGYADLTKRVVFTIDPPDARDFDDALSLDAVTDEPGVVWRLGVHIADVGHYVPWDGALDLDARRRATSVYLADRVLPMLPEALSNHICSLEPHTERRSYTVDMFLDAQGVVVRTSLYPAIIRSCARLTYDVAQAVLDNPENTFALCSLPIDASQVVERLIALDSIATLRFSARLKRGGMDFDSVEAKVTLDAEGVPTGYVLRRKTHATQLVEEAMIMANEAVARHLVRTTTPGMFRVHEQPALENLEALIPVLREFDWFADVDEYLFVNGNAPVISQVVELSKGKPESELVSSLVLRSMKRAVYSPECLGHYGLASQAYCHFTSPIRRYPDLVVHRMLHALRARGRGGKSAGLDAQVQALPWLSEHASEMERIADKAARQSQECKLLQLMEPCIGQLYSGIISGVMTYGFYVRLENTLEGLVSLDGLEGEYYAFDPVRHMLTGQETGRRYRMGQRVAVVLKAVDARRRIMDLRLA
ncbi:MAG: VacB/RNase II family 3'-5' exoribonuclease [Coriobacteriia bacterium]|nr:VacB/RNase II family 3'-5' exoribonuclease [Coriobacteriia bacterium]